MSREALPTRVSNLLNVYARRKDPESQLVRWALKQLQQSHVALQLLRLGAENASTVDAPWVEEIAVRGLRDLEEEKKAS